MIHKYFDFTSQGYLNTLAATPDIFERALEIGDYSPETRGIIDLLMLGTYPRSLAFPVEFTVFDGKKLRDVIEMQWCSAFLISNRLRDIFQTEGLTGWQTFDVIVRKKNGEVIPGYCGFSVIGRCPCEVPKSADAPDFFHPESKARGFRCSQKVIDVLRKYKIRDFDISNPIYDKDGNNVSWERIKI